MGNVQIDRYYLRMKISIAGLSIFFCEEFGFLNIGLWYNKLVKEV
jgi:hypothetical protein